MAPVLQGVSFVVIRVAKQGSAFKSAVISRRETIFSPFYGGSVRKSGLRTPPSRSAADDVRWPAPTHSRGPRQTTSRQTTRSRTFAAAAARIVKRAPPRFRNLALTPAFTFSFLFRPSAVPRVNPTHGASHPE